MTARYAALCFALFAVMCQPNTYGEEALDFKRVEEKIVGKTADGQEVRVFTLRNKNGLEADVIPFGATLLAVRTPDRDGNLANIVLTKDPVEAYEEGGPLGQTIGRFANRIAGASFTIDGVEYPLLKNHGEHQLHGGGREGFAWRIWDAKVVEDDETAIVGFTLVSPDDDAGFPGKMAAGVLYMLNDDNELTMDWSATTDKPTHVNLTNHAYWNLTGDPEADADGHLLTLQAGHYLPTDETLIPTGEIRSVEGTPLDFTEEHAVGKRLDEMDPPRYDHCFVVDRESPTELVLCASVVEPSSGRTMTVKTTQPGVQLYTGNAKAICLETQGYPDAPNKPSFPSSLLRPGEQYREMTVHQFGVIED